VAQYRINPAYQHTAPAGGVPVPRLSQAMDAGMLAEWDHLVQATRGGVDSGGYGYELVTLFNRVFGTGHTRICTNSRRRYYTQLSQHVLTHYPNR